MARYEERITELHSVIAELRKKLDRSQIGIIRFVGDCFNWLSIIVL